VQKQLTLADHVFVVYEAGPGGFHLHRQLIALCWAASSCSDYLASQPHEM